MQINLTEQQLQIITELMHLGVKQQNTTIQQTMAFSQIVSYIDMQIKEAKNQEVIKEKKDGDKE